MAGTPNPVTKRARIADVALEAGVARSTAALALRDSPRLRAETRLTVQQAAERLGYVYNRSAARLRSGRSYVIGMLVCEITNPFYAELTVGVQAALESAGYAVLLANTAESPARQRRMLERFREQSVDGIIMMPATGTPASLLDELDEWGLPCVTVVRGFRHGAHAGPDNAKGTRLATEHLLRLGHRDIAFLGGAARNSVSSGRWEGYARAMTARGLTPLHLPCRTDMGEASDFVATLTPAGPTALVCFNDSVAFGASLGLLRAGRQPGRDVALTGFDDIREASSWFPPLTTVRVAAVDIGIAGARILLDRIADPSAPARRETLAPTLMVRASCGTGRKLPTARRKARTT